MAGVQRAGMAPHEAERSVGTRAMDEALWVLLRKCASRNKKKLHIRGLALGAPRKPRFFG